MKVKTLGLLVLLLGVIMGSVGAQDSGRTTITADNIRQLELLIRLGRGTANRVAWSPDGATILVGGSLGVWKYDPSALDTADEPPLVATSGELFDFAIKPDGSTLLVSHTDGRGVGLYDFASGELSSVRELDTGNPNSVNYSADGRYALLNFGSRGFAVVDLDANVTVVTSTSGIDGDVDMLMTPENDKIIAATTSNTILIWDFPNDPEPTTLSGHTGSIEDMALSADGTLLVSGSTDDSFIVWNVADGTLAQTVTQPSDDFSNRDVYAVAFSPDGTILLSGHGAAIRFWDVADGVQTKQIDVQGRVTDIVYSPDGAQLVALTAEQATAVHLFDATGTKIATTNYHNDPVNAISFSPNNAVLAFNDTDSFLYMWDVATGGEINNARKHADATTFGLDNKSNITFSSDNQYMAVLTSFDASLRNAESGELIRKFSDVDGIAEDIEFSPDNTLLAFVTSQGLYIFEVNSGARIAFFDDARDWMSDVTWSPDQTLLATAASDGAVRIYAIGGE